MSNFILNDPNINSQSLTPKQIELSYLLTGNPNRRVILFRPDLIPICKQSPWAVLIFDQLYYYLEWKAETTKKPITEIEIYKFIKPCPHPKYKKGDSFIEELQITEKKFRTELNKIGFKTNYKTTKQEIKKSKALILYRKDRNNVTWYKLNPFILSNIKFDNTINQTPSSPKRQKKVKIDSKKSVSGNNKNIKKHNSDFSVSGSDETDALYNNIEYFSKKTFLKKNKKRSFLRLVKQGSKKINNSDGGGATISGVPPDSSCSKELIEQEVQTKQDSCNTLKDLILEPKPKINEENIKEHKTNVSLNLPKRLPKIKLPKKDPKLENLKQFNFSKPVYTILAHWYEMGGKIPQRIYNRKSADHIANLIEELLIPGLNSSYVKVLEEKDFALRIKKWTVSEIIQCIDHHVKVMKKETKSFLEFLLMNHNPKLPAYSPFINAFNHLPEQMNYPAQYLKYKFKLNYPDVFIYDAVFINVGKQLDEIHQKYEVVNEVGPWISPPVLFYDYIVDLANEKGKDVLQYMSSKKTIEQFMKYKKYSFELRKKDNPRKKEIQDEYEYYLRTEKAHPNFAKGLTKIRFDYLKELCE